MKCFKCEKKTNKQCAYCKKDFCKNHIACYVQPNDKPMCKYCANLWDVDIMTQYISQEELDRL